MHQEPDLARTLFYGDNLHVLRNHVLDESVDLVYLDPPFYSQRNYQALFKHPSIQQNGHTRVPAFGDVWRWETTTGQSYSELLLGAPTATIRVLNALHELLGESPLLAYLVMLTERLLELHRVLKPTGSLYLHCDPTASHYLKLVLDAIFGPANFRNEIVWSYKTGGASQRHFARKHDLIFFYARSERAIFHTLKEKSYMMHRYGFKKSTFLRDSRGEYTWVHMKDVWELPSLGAADGQRLGYPTQKPEPLLERIIQASSDEGALVLDPFCGSGTTLAVAQRLGRHWLGIENNALGIAYQRYRLASAYPQLRSQVIGGPTTLAEAYHLAREDVAQFRWWALSLVSARPIGTKDVAADEEGEVVHGILPGSSDSLVLIVLEPLEHTALQWLCTRQTRTNVTRLLIITLQVPDETLYTRLTSALTSANTSFSQIDILPLAKLLAEREAIPQVH